MTDRELLELAAKAAGYGCRYANQLLGCEVWDEGREQSEFWNPLDSDGEALRLAVKLRIDIHEAQEWYYTDESFEQDPYAATRRAIVRAAAEIGRTK